MIFANDSNTNVIVFMFEFSAMTEMERRWESEFYRFERMLKLIRMKRIFAVQQAKLEIIVKPQLVCVCVCLYMWLFKVIIHSIENRIWNRQCHFILETFIR